MPTNSSRNVLRTLVLSVITALMAASFALLATPAQASWTTSTTVHDAKVQVCKVKRKGNWAVKLRVNNKRATHGHYGTLFRVRGGRTTSIKVWAKRGKVSSVKQLGWRTGDSLETMISERNGVGAGGGVGMGHVKLC